MYDDPFETGRKCFNDAGRFAIQTRVESVGLNDSETDDIFELREPRLFRYRVMEWEDQGAYEPDIIRFADKLLHEFGVSDVEGSKLDGLCWFLPVFKGQRTGIKVSVGQIREELAKDLGAKLLWARDGRHWMNADGER